MLIKLSVVLFLVQIFLVKGEKLDWDLAIVVENEIQLLSSDGSLLYSRKPFSLLKAIAYDGIRDQFIVSDRDTKNDTIFTVRLSKETATEPIIKGPPGDVQGLAIDPVDDVLYWTNAINHTISYVNLNDPLHDTKEFMVFRDTKPHAIAVDSCNRYLYYTTNLSGRKPTIERRTLDNSQHDVLVSDTISSPVGLAIDYKEQRLYWADNRPESESGRIESITLDGQDRRIVIEKTSMLPFGLAVDEEAIYWTDMINYGLYRFFKNETNPHAAPTKLAKFPAVPMGLVSNSFMKDDCKNLSAVVKEYQENKKDSYKPIDVGSVDESLQCLNGGTVNGTRCDCKRGFRGKYCEISVCNANYCLNGNCYLSSSGKPTCSCNKGFVGARCQRNKCDSYCLNEGECILTAPRNVPNCSCLEGFIGGRCEYNQQICDLYCSDREASGISDQFELMCRCSYYLYSIKNTSSALQSSLQEQPNLFSKFQDPIVILSAFGLVCMLIIIVLAIYIHVIQKRRPRIKKRIIVNKNVTPLTYRPQPSTEQCEITIENCCNMNICDTPCFEPTVEDKKKLLTNMEGEDLY